MFVRYLKVFHQHHKKYLTRLSIKTKLIIGIINEDIIIKQLNSSGISNIKSNKQAISDEESILKYVGNTDSDNITEELTTIVSNISKSEDTQGGIYSNSSNSTISSVKSDTNKEEDYVLTPENEMPGDSVEEPMQPTEVEAEVGVGRGEDEVLRAVEALERRKEELGRKRREATALLARVARRGWEGTQEELRWE
jgi:hypothetical protein